MFARIAAFFLCFVLSLFGANSLEEDSQSKKGLAIIGDLPPDHSLLRKIQGMTDLERMAFSPEYETLLQLLKERLNSNEEQFNGPIHEELSASEALEIFGPFLNNDPKINQVICKSFAPEFYFFKPRSQKTEASPDDYFTQIELEEIFHVAKRILEMTRSGDILISLGQSPAYIIEALEELVSPLENDQNFRKILKVPISGAPDFCMNNFHYKKLSLSNITTPSSIQFFRKVMEAKGVSPSILGSEKRIFLIDLVGTGGSLTAFLKILVNGYRDVGQSLPPIHLLDISVENRNFKSLSQIQLPFAENGYFLFGPRFYPHHSPFVGQARLYRRARPNPASFRSSPMEI